MLVLRPARSLATHGKQAGDRHAHGVDAGAGLGLAPPGAEAAGARASWCRPLTALALNDLTFGTVLPGIPSSVAANDAAHAGLFEIQGPAGASVRVDFVLPSALAV